MHVFFVTHSYINCNGFITSLRLSINCLIYQWLSAFRALSIIYWYNCLYHILSERNMLLVNVGHLYTFDNKLLQPEEYIDGQRRLTSFYLYKTRTNYMHICLGWINSSLLPFSEICYYNTRSINKMFYKK